MNLCGPVVTVLVALVFLAPLARAGEPVPKPGAEAAAEETVLEEFTDDLVILKSDLAIEGRVVGRDEKAVQLLVEYGVLSIPRAAVKRIEYNLTSRLGELAEDDHAGRYEVLARAIEEGNISQAGPRLEELVRKPGVPPEIYRLLARVCQSEGDLKRALAHWKKYALAKPDDQEAKRAVAELTEELGPEAKGTAAGGAAKKAAGAGKPGAPGPPGPDEGLEVGGKWTAQGWGNPATATVQSLEGNSVLMVDIAAGGTKEKTAIMRQVKLNLSGNEKLRFRVFNSGKARAGIAVALITSKDYYESRPVPAMPGWNTDLSVDLKGKKWKCKATGWTFKAGLEGLESVRQIIFLVYGKATGVLLYFDEVRAE